MRLYTIGVSGKKLAALELCDGKLYPVTDLGFPYNTMLELIRCGREEDLAKLRDLAASEAVPGELEGKGFDKAAVVICSPIPEPDQDIVCLGLNYNEHILETTHVEDFREKEATVYFAKRAARISGPSDIIPAYSFVDTLDYEVELAVILGRTIKNYRKEEGDGCIFGYAVFNDVSARTLQFRHKQWYVGKSLDGYSVMGPCIVTADEIGDPQDLAIKCYVNDELRQSSNTRYMIQPVLDAIEEFSQGITMKAGTIIATGTPGGVAVGMENPKYLQSGDTVRCEIEKIGAICNRVG